MKYSCNNFTNFNINYNMYLINIYKEIGYVTL